MRIISLVFLTVFILSSFTLHKFYVSTTSIKFTNAKIPVENLLYEVGKGAAIAFNALNIGRYKLGAASVGGSKQAIKQTLTYALERKQFGSSIGEFQLMQGKIADLYTETNAARAFEKPVMLAAAMRLDSSTMMVFEPEDRCLRL